MQPFSVLTVLWATLVVVLFSFAGHMGHGKHDATWFPKTDNSADWHSSPDDFKKDK